jgi:hypothetical protein
MLMCNGALTSEINTTFHPSRLVGGVLYLAPIRLPAPGLDLSDGGGTVKCTFRQHFTCGEMLNMVVL